MAAAKPRGADAEPARTSSSSADTMALRSAISSRLRARIFFNMVGVSELMEESLKF
jgi:hypothetical protein